MWRLSLSTGDGVLGLCALLMCLLLGVLSCVLCTIICEVSWFLCCHVCIVLCPRTCMAPLGPACGCGDMAYWA